MTLEQFKQRYQYQMATDKLGEGGFGEVVKAYDTQEQQYVAIKISKVESKFGKFTLKREVELAKKMDSHTHILRYLQCYEIPIGDYLYHYATMPYYPYDLAKLLRSQTLTLPQKHQIITGLLQGLSFLHIQENVIHRDLKPSNILIYINKQGDFVPKIADFGLSKATDGEASSISNSANALSIYYAAPEQLNENLLQTKRINYTIDVWAMGVIVFEMFVQQRPFASTSQNLNEAARADITNQILTQAPSPQALKKIPQPYQTLVQQALQKEPHQRPPNAQKLLELLSQSVVERSRNEPPSAPAEPKTGAETTQTPDAILIDDDYAPKTTAAPAPKPQIKAVEQKPFNLIAIICIVVAVIVGFGIYNKADKSPTTDELSGVDSAAMAPAVEEAVMDSAAAVVITVLAPLRDGEPSPDRYTGYAQAKIYQNGDFFGTYEGAWRKGLPHGEGTTTFPDGSRHTGKYYRGTMKGYGTYYTPGGSIDYQGNYPR